MGSPVGPQGLALCMGTLEHHSSPSDGPFPSSAALPTKRPPAPTRSTATESASGLAAKPSVRTWDSLSSKFHPFWGGFSGLGESPRFQTGTAWGWQAGDLETGPDTPKSVCLELGGPVQKEETPGIAAGEETHRSGQEQAAGSGGCSSLLGGKAGGSRWQRGRPLLLLVGSGTD